MGSDLDFSALFETVEETADQTAEPEQESPADMFGLESIANREKSLREEVRKVCAEYQDNIKKAGQARQTILIRLKKKNPDYRELFLIATEAISAMTGDRGFSDCVRQQIAENEIPPEEIQLPGQQDLNEYFKGDGQ